MAKFDEGMESMLDTYIYEENQLLEQLDEILMRTERAQEIAPDDIAEIFRIMHTIKGSSSMMGLSNMQKLSHAVEDLFSILRDKPDTPYDKDTLFNLVFSASDSLKNEIDVIQDDSAELTDFTQQIAGIRAYADVMKLGSAQNTVALPKEAIFEEGESDEICALLVKYSESCLMPSVRAMLLLRSLGNVCEVTRTIPSDLDADTANDVIAKDGLVIKLICDDKNAVIETAKNAMNVEDASWLEREEKPSPQPQPQQTEKEEKPSETAPKEEPKKESKSKAADKSSIISVKLSKLDALLDLVSEIVITESTVTSSPDLKGFEGSLERFNTAARNLKKLTDELQDVVMSIRMVPVSNAFSKMSRVVRDMNQKLHKNVELKFVGEETEVDKSVVDILNDPLMHLVRNAVDHGIEEPEERERKGKTEKPTVTLRAENASGEVVITVEDNGAGMDHTKILAKAKKKGLLRKPEEEYTKSEALSLIMRAGFSTNENVTEYSGRGVGMDVVKQNIEKVGGKLVVESDLGVGSRFVIKIPLSLSITDVMQVSVGQTDLSIPISSVKEIFKLKPETLVRDTEGTELCMIRGRCYPVIRLSEYFGVESEITELTDGIMIFCEDDHMRACLFADSLIGEQQIVVKPFSPYLAQHNIAESGLSGCSILADGSITLIVDVKTIISNIFGN